ncbi:hypothetical protein [uncultured Methanospirillum sp.]|uniref:hypothetical protein n=1 Tax=uncultured Methanospirillum sp. TaxID=262503 RepID=UPI0029C84E67|nr:hypothetical protein [uncultured Methanospirillum sp.]
MDAWDTCDIPIKNSNTVREIQISSTLINESGPQKYNLFLNLFCLHQEIAHCLNGSKCEAV